MFDIAYTNEAIITAAEIYKKSIWEKVLEMDCSKPLAGFYEMAEISRMNNYITYYSIMYHTHGV